jgi:predicted membrane channel-forming protein YqfA (hemolysin III family)
MKLRPFCGGAFFIVLRNVTGGVTYTIGAIIYGIGKKRKWFHGVGVVFYVVLRI